MANVLDIKSMKYIIEFFNSVSRILYGEANEKMHEQRYNKVMVGGNRFIDIYNRLMYLPDPMNVDCCTSKVYYLEVNDTRDIFLHFVDLLKGPTSAIVHKKPFVGDKIETNIIISRRHFVESSKECGNPNFMKTIVTTIFGEYFNHIVVSHHPACVNNWTLLFSSMLVDLYSIMDGDLVSLSKNMVEQLQVPSQYTEAFRLMYNSDTEKYLQDTIIEANQRVRLLPATYLRYNSYANTDPE